MNGLTDTGLDYTSLIKTEAYLKFVMETPNMFLPFTKFFSGFELDLIGDLHSISVHGTNEVDLTVHYDMYGTEPLFVRVIVRDEKQKEIARSKMKTNRGVKLRVRCIKADSTLFELVEAIETDNICVYGQWICKSCGQNYGYDSMAGYKCNICGKEVKQMFDFYGNGKTEKIRKGEHDNGGKQEKVQQRRVPRDA